MSNDDHAAHTSSVDGAGEAMWVPTDVTTWVTLPTVLPANGDTPVVTVLAARATGAGSTGVVVSRAAPTSESAAAAGVGDDAGRLFGAIGRAGDGAGGATGVGIAATTGGGAALARGANGAVRARKPATPATHKTTAVRPRRTQPHQGCCPSSSSPGLATP